MKVIKTSIPGLIIIEPKVFGDQRGFFMETYHAARYRDEAGITSEYVQDNHSRSSRGVLRGLHFQKTKIQGKLLRCIFGEIYDVAVDLRKGSPSYGQWEAVTLSAENKRQISVPAGFAHGFQVVSEIAEVEYKCTDFYDPGDEGGIAWNDPMLSIPWPVSDPILSAKDLSHPNLSDLA
jgi:dTDP-4-dehydrorhamnose 3,5-epimerase